MSNLLLSVMTLVGGLRGVVTYYNPGVMETVLENRVRWGHVERCEACVGMVALLERQYVGKRVWLQRPGYAAEGPFLVVDCANGKDLERLRRRGVVAEVDWRTARRWGMRGPLRDVAVIFAEAGKGGRYAGGPVCGGDCVAGDGGGRGVADNGGGAAAADGCVDVDEPGGGAGDVAQC